ncbi:methylated-DNA--[protein]-cysteine S-methyltransferase [Pseudofulvimonas gallinarii]|uniref:Methylated-DNA--protein-cysteine methyltransferase n=2 Tax=Pseudofulvimonas gallinarii TaxID=634155 RepID=A0A4S3L023_9GAMM|nr:methylated-DNA--[protein]-cysteine S-methyltransferase [Pseudofulvimonas gallinarii]TCS93694.1 methylated-DNA-[protein]-cysteine S-methyltransferase [Pseudofulvimonas gallinarii]THD14258.1 cysteine methyltransferase [Pseudofulvimonas gallinarii]
MSVVWCVIDSPIGSLRVATDTQGLYRIEFPPLRPPAPPSGESWLEGRSPILDAAAAQLRDYFEGRRNTFDLPLSPRGTAFQRRVWDELLRIPYGRTISYGELARRVGNPSASRAVGAANGRNPLPIVVPCHRVIGTGGALTGFAGGLPIKAFLLRLEGALPHTDLRLV